MELLNVMGAAPGHLVAMVRHDDELVRLHVEVARHPLGGWQARRMECEWSTRCTSLETAILFEAGETLEMIEAG